jgi:hypothetical protein
MLTPLPDLTSGRPRHPYGQKIDTVTMAAGYPDLAIWRSLVAHRQLYSGRESGAAAVGGGPMGELMEWARFLAYITGTVDQELLLRNEYLVAENRILKGQVKGRLTLSNSERVTLGEIGHRLGRKALGEVATAALPDTMLGWYRRCGPQKLVMQQRGKCGVTRQAQVPRRSFGMLAEGGALPRRMELPGPTSGAVASDCNR